MVETAVGRRPLSCSPVSNERTLYDSFGVRVTTSRMVFPSASYVTRDVTSVEFVVDAEPALGSYVVMALGAALFFYGAFTGTLWGFAGVVAIVGAQLRLLRRRARRGYGVRITTRAGSKIAYAARDRTLVEDVAAAVREAIASVTDAPAPPRSARGRRRR